MLSGDYNRKTLAAGPITYVRMTIVARAMARLGHEVLVTPHFSINKATGEIAGYDVHDTARKNLITGFDVVVGKQLMRLHHSSVIERARACGQQVWMDVDDWYFGIDVRNVAWAAIQKKSNPKANVENLRQAFASATGLLCSTPYLAHRMAKTNQHSVYCRNSVDIRDWPDPKPLEGQEMRAGWIAGLKYRSGDLETLKGIIEPFLLKHNGTFVHVGYIPNEDKFGVEDLINLDGVNFEVFSAVNRAQFAEFAFDPFNLGLVPLSYTPFNESKSNLKGLEYSMAGKPFIAAATREYQYLAACGIGRVAKRPHNWLRHLETLLDPELRQEEGLRNYELTVQEFDIDKRVHEWVSAFEGKPMYSVASDVSSKGRRSA